MHGNTNRDWAVCNAQRAIASGDTPFRFWFGQRTLSLAAVSKRSGIDQERLLDFDRGEAVPTDDEAEILAPILHCEPSDLRVAKE